MSTMTHQPAYDLQDKITESVVDAVEPSVQQKAEIERVRGGAPCPCQCNRSVVKCELRLWQQGRSADISAGEWRQPAMMWRSSPAAPIGMPSARKASRSRARSAIFHLKDVNVADDVARVGPADLVLFAVKLREYGDGRRTDLSAARPDTRVITLQKWRRQRRSPRTDPWR